jgi:glycosyltransferase involved in cell wall biosynthesis
MNTVPCDKTGLLGLLPPPPAGKQGWPWTCQTNVPGLRRDGLRWPRISIVTPSYNQGRFLEETIRSVLLQNYPSLEYIVMDGGSTDESVTILRKYEKFISYWTSEKDRGQADAIYRGFARSTGGLLAWINSDDFYLPSTLHKVANEFRTTRYALLTAGMIIVDTQSTFKRDWLCLHSNHRQLLCCGQFFGQPASFWTRDAFFGVEGFDRSLRYAFDYDLFLRLTKDRGIQVVNDLLAAYRTHEASKSETIFQEVGLAEIRQLQHKYGIQEVPPRERRRITRRFKVRMMLHRRMKSRKSSLLNRVLNVLLPPG